MSYRLRTESPTPFIADPMPAPPSPPRSSVDLFFVALILLALTALALRADPIPQTEIRRSLEGWEGYRQTPYRDGRRGWAVGIGHSLTAHAQSVRRYSPAEIERFYTVDLDNTLRACRAGISRFDDLPHPVQLVCLNVAFTVGRTGFFRMIRFRLAIGRRDYREAAAALEGYLWSSQVSPARASWAITTLRTQLTL